ncbi:cupin [Guptibacillus spartinae]|uniref:cupin n=1 Tax=Guptibacillus spartinae TaxID=3025679 RepID=UPI002361C69C|nr:cupin [Pseudalkalibacillus spartinae]
MRVFNYSRSAGKEITKFGSQFVMSRITQTESSVHIGAMYLDKEGLIGLHQAVTPQLLLIVSGEGLVRGEENELVKVKEGDAVFWNKDEWHETTTEKGLTAIAIEGELNPDLFLSEKEPSEVQEEF